MNKLLKSARTLLIRAQLDAPPALNRTAAPHLRDLKDAVDLLTRPYLPVWEAHGQGKDGPLSVVFVNVKKPPSSLRRLLFVDKPTERHVGILPLWRWREIADWPSGDLVIASGGRSLIRQLPYEGAIVLPGQVSHVLDLSGDWPTVEGRIHQRLLKSLQRQVQKHGYEFSVSHDERDFDKFYRQMYQPTMRVRHGEDSQPVSRYEAYEYFKRGYLFQVKRDGDWVAGAIRHPEGNTLLGRMLGVRDADAEEMKRGVIPALYYGGIRWAHANGYHALDFLETWPLLDLGLFQFKRRWGTTVALSPRTRRRYWIKVRRGTSAVVGFLRDNPFVVVDENDRLHGLFVVDDPTSVSVETRLDWQKRYGTPGLDDLVVRSVSSFVGSEQDGQALRIPLPSDRVGRTLAVEAYDREARAREMS